jgi:hypothetical protein
MLERLTTLDWSRNSDGWVKAGLMIVDGKLRGAGRSSLQAFVDYLRRHGSRRDASRSRRSA